MTDSALLSCRGLSAAVDDKPILHNIDLDVPQGQVHVLMGPNGAGKSTLGHVLMGDPIYEVTDGSIQFDGQDVTELSPDKRSRAGLFLSFQAPVEIPGVPLRSFLRAMIEGRGEKLKNKEFRKLTQSLATTLDMDPSYLDRELGVGFSGGERKRIMLLRLILTNPKLAILDEPDSGADTSVKQQIADIIHSMPDTTFIFISHQGDFTEMVKPTDTTTLSNGKLVIE